MQFWQKLTAYFYNIRAVEFFCNNLSFIDFAIIGLGLFLIVAQLFRRLWTSKMSFFRNYKENPLSIVRTEVRMEYTANLIELLPMLGLFGTVWGLLNALVTIADSQAPTVKDIAINIAPAISTTFFGLLFAIINLWIYNLNHAFFVELIAWCRQNSPTKSP